jgi:hypothetical protein
MVEAIEPIEAFKPDEQKAATAFFVKGGVAAPWRAGEFGNGFFGEFTFTFASR